MRINMFAAQDKVKLYIENKGLKLGSGQAYDSLSDSAAVVA
jgi:hypothetical protein